MTYTTLFVESLMSEDDLKNLRKKDCERVVEYLKQQKDSKTEDELKKIWSILTSRGEDKEIYGAMPLL